ncbi:hypothetical protein FB567DRAFT_581670 [Paraphoma chrysanthemicola]|uniref:Uncharacterized protein n=1 Tax=Paraphoma chrysanthemicola TaxID=798071 RepID=A0A8K0R3B4_9PLEO|nr:hypothetical protein FB567DRAFT_581670 [Paraphoma chrysanthemicola]
MGNFRAELVVPQNEGCQIITDRIASRSKTRSVSDRPSAQAAERKSAYRNTVLKVLQQACTESEHANTLVDRFSNLAASLERTRGLVLPTECSGYHGEHDTQMRSVHGESHAHGGRLRAGSQGSEWLRTTLTDPLNIALLSFHMGGPIKATSPAYYSHQWKLPRLPASLENTIHTEGDIGDVFDDHRLTLVYETREGGLSGVSGTHHLFWSGDASPQELDPAIVNAKRSVQSPVVIIYDSRNAALVYECQDPEATRCSISLDFHLNSLACDFLHVLEDTKHDQTALSRLTLGDLLTTYAVPDYDERFHRLLFSPDSLGSIIKQLKDIEVEQPKVLQSPARPAFEHRIDAYKRENQSKIPPSILGMATDVRISGCHSSAAMFFDQVSLKARRDVHLPIGWDLLPQDFGDDSREWARKQLRNHMGERLLQRLAEYLPALTKKSHTPLDLISTQQLQSLANSVHERCLELVCDGYVDSLSMLPSVASFAFALGTAVNGTKEIEANAEPWVDEVDCQIFRTRCLYLFLCADWLVDYLGKPIKGPFMLSSRNKKMIAKARGEAGIIARLLLRNWVAWALFVEGLPNGGFWVRRTTSNMSSGL